MPDSKGVFQGFNVEFCRMTAAAIFGDASKVEIRGVGFSDSLKTLIAGGARLPDLLVDQGEADSFLEGQLRTQLLADACAAAGQPATIRMQPGYDHSYYFISTFMADHVAWHAQRLND